MSTDEEIREVYEGEIERRGRIVSSRRDGILEFYRGGEELRIDTLVPGLEELAEVGEMVRVAELGE